MCALMDQQCCRVPLVCWFRALAAGQIGSLQQDADLYGCMRLVQPCWGLLNATVLANKHRSACHWHFISSWRRCPCSIPYTMRSTYALPEPAVADLRSTSAYCMHSKSLLHGVLLQFQGQPLLAARGAGLGSDALRQGWTLIPDDSIAAEVWQTLSSKVSCQIHKLLTPVSISITPEF